MIPRVLPCKHWQLTHPNIISLCDLQSESVNHALFLEYCPNGTSDTTLPMSVSPEMIENNSCLKCCANLGLCSTVEVLP
jgi:hypothetical protein